MPDASTKGHSLGDHTWWSLGASLYNGDLGTEPPSGLGAEPLVREDFDPEIGRSLRLHNLRGCPICPRIRRTFGGWPLGSVGVSQTGSVGILCRVVCYVPNSPAVFAVFASLQHTLCCFR